MKEDSKRFCKFIQSKTKTKENEQGEINTDDRIKAELMNNCTLRIRPFTYLLML